MISYHEGDLLKSNCDVICHQVNLQGVMGGGLALQIARKFPQVEHEYKHRIYCVNKMPLLMESLKGTFQCCNVGRGYILNCFTQDENFNTNYNWLELCFTRIKKWAFAHRVPSEFYIRTTTIGVPFNYGCGIANGDWDKVLTIFKEIFEDVNWIDFQIWKLKGEKDE